MARSIPQQEIHGEEKNFESDSKINSEGIQQIYQQIDHNQKCFAVQFLSVIYQTDSLSLTFTQ